MLWTDEIQHHLETMFETIVCWYLQGNHQKPGLLRRCEMDFVHPQCQFGCLCIPGHGGHFQRGGGRPSSHQPRHSTA